jgi:hypothetical protein
MGCQPTTLPPQNTRCKDADSPQNDTPLIAVVTINLEHDIPLALDLLTNRLGDFRFYHYATNRCDRGPADQFPLSRLGHNNCNPPDKDTDHVPFGEHGKSASVQFPPSDSVRWPVSGSAKNGNPSVTERAVVSKRPWTR